jgi:hypothetical protein
MKIQIKTLVSALILTAAISLNVKAQSLRPAGIRYSIGADAGLPISHLSDYYKWSLGGSIQADIPVLAPDLYFTINTGYTNIFSDSGVSKDIQDVHLIPVKAGLKYFAAANFYVQGEAGVSFILNEGLLVDKSASFTWAPQIGYLIPLGGSSFLDAGVRFEGNSKFYNSGKSNNFIGLRVAYAFSLGSK